MSRRLNDEEVVATLERLHARIAERFPDAGLSDVCKDLAASARTVARRSRGVARPYLLTRLTVLLVLGGAAFLAYEIWAMGLTPGLNLQSSLDPATLAQGLDSGVNLLIVTGAAVWFLLGWETRLKRERTMADLHELRSFAHVIDMHQLTKDPTMVLGGGPSTPSSPRRAMTEFQLTRYLEYCAEMLALIGKLAALYAEHTRDAQVVAAVNDVESLTANLGRKIWQKITILSALDESRAG